MTAGGTADINGNDHRRLKIANMTVDRSRRTHETETSHAAGRPRSAKHARVAKFVSFSNIPWNGGFPNFAPQFYPPPQTPAPRRTSDRRPAGTRPAEPPEILPMASFLPAVPQDLLSPSPSTRPRVRAHFPGEYDIVSRGQMPAIVFHNDNVELLYRLPTDPNKR